jgi:hypothetical protein
MGADSFRDDLLSFLFLRYLSDHDETAAKKKLGKGCPDVGSDTRKVHLALWYTHNVDNVPAFENADAPPGAPRHPADRAAEGRAHQDARGTCGDREGDCAGQGHAQRLPAGAGLEAIAQRRCQTRPCQPRPPVQASSEVLGTRSPCSSTQTQLEIRRSNGDEGHAEVTSVRLTAPPPCSTAHSTPAG